MTAYMPVFSRGFLWFPAKITADAYGDHWRAARITTVVCGWSPADDRSHCRDNSEIDRGYHGSLQMIAFFFSVTRFVQLACRI